jgi:hypothetical protein
MVDIMPRISGVEFQDAWQRRVTVPIDDGLTASFISRQDLLVAKMAAGRPQDLADAVALRESMRLRETERSQSPHVGSSTFDSIREAQARGVEEWLKLRQQQLVDGRMPTPQEMQAKGREEWKKYRDQQSAKSEQLREPDAPKDSTLNPERGSGKEIDDDLSS